MPRTRHASIMFAPTSKQPTSTSTGNSRIRCTPSSPATSAAPTATTEAVAREIVAAQIGPAVGCTVDQDEVEPEAGRCEQGELHAGGHPHAPLDPLARGEDDADEREDDAAELQAARPAQPVAIPDAPTERSPPRPTTTARPRRSRPRPSRAVERAEQPAARRRRLRARRRRPRLARADRGARAAGGGRGARPARGGRLRALLRLDRPAADGGAIWAATISRGTASVVAVGAALALGQMGAPKAAAAVLVLVGCFDVGANMAARARAPLRPDQPGLGAVVALPDRHDRAGTRDARASGRSAPSRLGIALALGGGP